MLVEPHGNLHRAFGDQLRRLHDHNIARRKLRCGDAEDLVERKIPRLDREDRPYRLFQDERALDAGETVAAYAYARTGYHRGLDQLRRNGWKGFGPVPWSHEPNQGFLRSGGALLRAATAIGEAPEVERLRTLINDSDPEALAALGVS